MSDDLVAALGSVPLFESLSRKELESLARSGREVVRDVGHEITTEGEEGIAFFLMLEGSADINVSGTTLRSVGPGDHFGEIALIDGGPRTATVTVTQPARLFGLSAWNFRPMLSEHPDMTQKILMSLCKMVRSYTQT